MDRITLLIHKSYELTGWLICHYNKQNQEFGLKETDIIRLFKGNKLLVKEDYINHLNSFYLEMKTIYYVWKNKRKSNQVACHYRRLFEDYLDVEEGRCQVMAINYGCSVFQHYKVAHNYQDLYDVVDVLNEQCGRNKKYSKYLLNSGVFIPCCCFVMQWNGFDKFCSWLFPILFAWDKKSGVNIGPEKYMEGAKCDFRYDNPFKNLYFSWSQLFYISCELLSEIEVFVKENDSFYYEFLLPTIAYNKGYSIRQFENLGAHFQVSWGPVDFYERKYQQEHMENTFYHPMKNLGIVQLKVNSNKRT